MEPRPQSNDIEGIEVDSTEKLNGVSFDGVPYPKDGWAVIVAGAIGSDKACTIGNQVLINAQIIDAASIGATFAKMGRTSDAGGDSTLPNIIFDIEGQSSTKLMNISRTCKKFGYRTSLIWLIADRQTAMGRNLKSNCVVGERLFDENHHQVNSVLPDFIQSSDSKDYDEAWIVFNGSINESNLSKEKQKKISDKSVISSLLPEFE